MEVRDNALGFEAVKVSMHQTKDGIKITLVIHPDDVPPGLFSDPVGQRYQVGMVAVADDGQPLQRVNKQHEEVVRSAAILCKNPKFMAWVAEHSHFPATEEGAAAFIRDRCKVVSRSDIPLNDVALNTFNMMRLKFSQTLEGR